MNWWFNSATKGNNLSLEGNKAILTVREASTVEQRRYVKDGIGQS